MLGDSKVAATVASRDVAKAHAFYSGTLGLPVMMSADDVAAYLLPDGSAFFVYARPNHRPPENTSATFLVTDFEAQVRDLKGRGVKFEDYDMPEAGIKTVDGVATDPGRGMKAAWFKDPDGNILSVAQAPTT